MNRPKTNCIYRPKDNNRELTPFNIFIKLTPKLVYYIFNYNT
jgi:hypothetical protein